MRYFGARRNHPQYSLQHPFSGCRGLTMIEMLVGLFILGILMTGFHQVIANALSAFDAGRRKQDLLSQAHYAMDRMTLFAGSTDEIKDPSAGQQKQWLVLSERALDTYNSSDHSYTAEGDGFLDSDNDGDGLVNEDASDPREYIRFDLDKTIEGNWKLTEKRPDYRTPDTGDILQPQVLCQNVAEFQAIGLSDSLVELRLTLNDGQSAVSLKTRVKSMYIE
jgi:prepilin-type N-terminal cleavage/methylation domain-containing protein